MLSKRLKKITSLIDENTNVIDVGCDHALLDIYLTINKNCHCTATDVNVNALNIANYNIKKYHLEDKIKTILSDGLKNIEIKKISTVVIAGMGTTTILQILKNINDNLIDNIVVASNNDYELLRKEISKKYHIENELVVEDRKKFYLILNLKKGAINYNKKQQYLGPLLKNNKDIDTINYYQYLYNKNIELINKLSKKYFYKKLKLKQKNNWIKKLNSK